MVDVLSVNIRPSGQHPRPFFSFCSCFRRPITTDLSSLIDSITALMRWADTLHRKSCLSSPWLFAIKSPAPFVWQPRSGALGVDNTRLGYVVQKKQREPQAFKKTHCLSDILSTEHNIICFSHCRPAVIDCIMLQGPDKLLDFLFFIFFCLCCSSKNATSWLRNKNCFLQTLHKMLCLHSFPEDTSINSSPKVEWIFFHKWAITEKQGTLE